MRAAGSATATAGWRFAVAGVVLCTVLEVVDNAPLPLPCKPWDDDATLIKHDLMARLKAERANPSAASSSYSLGTRAKHDQPLHTLREGPSFDLVVITSSRPRSLALSYFGVTAGSLVGQGVYTGTVRVSYNGALEKSRYIETAASLLGFEDRLLAQRLPTDILNRADVLDQSEPIDRSYHKMAANYVQALGLQRLHLKKSKSKVRRGSLDHEGGGGDRGGADGNGGGKQNLHNDDKDFLADADSSRTAAAATAAVAEIPLVILEDDVLVAAHFELRLERLLRGLRKALPEGTHYILSLYMAYNEAARAEREAELVAPGVVKYPPGWFYATQGIVFSDSQVRNRFIKFYLSKCLNVPIGWNKGRGKPTCDGSDMVMQMFLQAIAKVHDDSHRNGNFNHGGNAAIGIGGDRIELYGVQHALVQHLSKSNHTTVGSISQPHRVQNYVDSRVPCKRLKRTKA